jgi:tungstate transport system permease protein
MTTAITLLRNKGNYTDAIILGVVLLVLAFLVQSAADLIRRREGGDENI